MTKVNAYAAENAGNELSKYNYELPQLGNEEVDIKVLYSGVCHSDLSMINNEWGMTQYPFVGGHEIIGEIVAIGDSVKNLELGDKVGLGWMSGSCMHCDQCYNGHQHTCASSEQTIVGRHGGFADLVRANWSATIKLPEGIDLAKAGPLLCGGITVFNSISEIVKPTDKVGVIGIGGLGHMALKFLNAWGCEVIAFSSNPAKKDSIMNMGAHKIINSRDTDEIASITGQLDYIINTTNVTLNWDMYLAALSPKGHFHNVGAVLEPLAIPAFSLIGGDKSVGGNGVGSPGTIKKMLEFCVRHNIYPTVEEFKMEDINAAIKHLEEGKARFRIVLKN